MLSGASPVSGVGDSLGQTSEKEVLCSDCCVITLKATFAFCPSHSLGGKHSFLVLWNINQNACIAAFFSSTSGQDNVHDFPFTIAFLLLSEETHVEVQEKVFCSICVAFIIILSALCYTQKIVEVVFSFLCIRECRSSLSEYWREPLWCQKIHFRIY